MPNMAATTPPPAFAALFMALGREPQERTRDELLHALGLGDDRHFLAKLAAAARALHEYGVEIHPRLQDDPPDGMFLLRRKGTGTYSENALLGRLTELESASQEFKSTYWCDLRRLSHDPAASSKQLRSESVKHSTLKSVAGFLTTGGGTLFIGVDDDGAVLGLHPDLRILGKGHRNVDQLINNIKTDIAHRFRDGNAVNDYVSIDSVIVRDSQILQLVVTSRTKLSFLAQPKGDHQLFRRQGNRTTVVKVYEFEEFQAWRDEYILHSYS